jgi:hypothetical protein
MKKVSDMSVVVVAIGLMVVGIRMVSKNYGDDKHRTGAARVHVLYGISGPNQASILPSMTRTTISSFHSGYFADHSKLAVLLTDEDSPWLGLAHGLKSIGIPFTFTRSYEEAFSHRTVLIYPYLNEDVLEKYGMAALRDFVNRGGKVLAVNARDLSGQHALGELFGFTTAKLSDARYHFSFDRVEGIDPKEAEIRFAAQKGVPALKTIGYAVRRDAREIAHYEDGSSAMTEKSLGLGKLYTLGFDLGGLALIAQDNRDESIERSYVNRYEPSLDIFLRWVRGFYRDGNDQAVTLHPVPEGKSLAMLLTHDIDYADAMKDGLRFARFEKSKNIRATYFIQTKYVRDSEDEAFFSKKTYPYLKEMKDLNMELASHSVSHSLQFNRFAMGTGREQFPFYAPFVEDSSGNTQGGSILGELRISKFLLEKLFDDNVGSFRPGNLRDPQALPEALVAAGYRYASSTTANNSLTHLPYGHDDCSESPIFEFPVTIEDEEKPALFNRLEDAVKLAHQIAVHGGLVTVLIHPNYVEGETDKLMFEEAFVDEVKDLSWFGSVSDLGQWWSARDKVDVQVQPLNSSEQQLILQAPEKISGLALDLAPGAELFAEEGGPSVSRVDGRYVLGEIQGRVVFRIKSNAIPLLANR